uniref:Transmembrane protein n=1 Tax=Fagus sylvatica TaxID=28930 RepID=A0A2N9J6M4_FAGSY
MPSQICGSPTGSATARSQHPLILQSRASICKEEGALTPISPFRCRWSQRDNFCSSGCCGIFGDYLCDFICVEIVELDLCGFDMVAKVGVEVVIVYGVTVWIWICVGLIWLLELWW